MEYKQNKTLYNTYDAKCELQERLYAVSKLILMKEKAIKINEDNPNKKQIVVCKHFSNHEKLEELRQLFHANSVLTTEKSYKPDSEKDATDIKIESNNNEMKALVESIRMQDSVDSRKDEIESKIKHDERIIKMYNEVFQLYGYIKQFEFTDGISIMALLDIEMLIKQISMEDENVLKSLNENGNSVRNIDEDLEVMFKEYNGLKYRPLTERRLMEIAKRVKELWDKRLSFTQPELLAGIYQ